MPDHHYLFIAPAEVRGSELPLIAGALPEGLRCIREDRTGWRHRWVYVSAQGSRGDAHEFLPSPLAGEGLGERG